MGDVVNLNKARKAAKRAQAKADVAANRVRYGRTGAQKAADRLAQDKLKQEVDQARLPDRPADLD